MKNKTRLIKTCNILCAVLMLVLLVCQFLPFWSANGDTASIQGYLWFPDTHSALTQYFQAETGSDSVPNDIAIMPILVLAAGVLGVVMCLWRSDKTWTAIFPLICGIAGIWGYLTKPAYQMGTLWVLHLILCIVMTVVAVVSAAACAKRIKGWFVSCP